MEHLSCHVIYVDKRTLRDRFEESVGKATPEPSMFVPDAAGLKSDAGDAEVNVRTILSIFDGVHIFASGESCIAKLRELHENSEQEIRPILVFVDTVAGPDADDRRRPSLQPPTPHSSPSPSSSPIPSRRDRLTSQSESVEAYGLSLIQLIHTEISCSNLSKLVLPLAVVQHQLQEVPAGRKGSLSPISPRARLASDGSGAQGPAKIRWSDRDGLDISAPVEPTRLMRCLEAGAVDVLASPLQRQRIFSLTAHAYRAHREALNDPAAFLATKRLRKRSWVGVEEEQPYGYLRESMVSTLMTSICKPESVLHSLEKRYVAVLNPPCGDDWAASLIKGRNVYALTERQEQHVAKAVGRWNFSAHDLSEDELAHAAFLMLQHALDMPELEHLRLPPDDLKSFLMACRSAYNAFVLYHNFRHVVDVLQAVFYFLLQIGTLPPYPVGALASDHSGQARSPIAKLLRPFDALTLLISAIGHDVGHPGVNNAFLVALKAPLAQLYNDSSVLEAFHCAAYSQILRRHWNSAFEDTGLRALLIKSILATDMGVHFKYMTDLGNLQEKIHHNGGTDGWSEKILDDYRVLACGLLIKCADISNVARPFKVASKWADVLQLEFARQGEMEKDVGIPTTLFGGPPELGNLTKLANSQIGFMNIFANPLFEAVADILPGMRFATMEIKSNTEVWKAKIEEQKHRVETKVEYAQYNEDGKHSPRSGSPGRPFSSKSLSELSHPEGLPASGSSPSLPRTPPLSSSFPVPGAEPRRASLGSVLSDANNRSADRSRRSSLGPPPPFSLPSIPQQQSPQDMSDLSRRSSGAYPAAKILPSSIEVPSVASGGGSGSISSWRRRSSNTLPSQLQLKFASVGGRDARNSQTRATAENLREKASYFQPQLSTSTDTSPLLPKSGSSGTSPRKGSSSSSAGTFGSPGTPASKGVDIDVGGAVNYPPLSSVHQHFSRPLASRHSTQPSSATTRFSTFSGSQARYSNTNSTAFTINSNSHAMPSSPTETRATSFFTQEGSETGSMHDGDRGHGEKNSRVETEEVTVGGRDGMPEGKEQELGGEEANRHAGQGMGESPGGGRRIRRKGSRFRFVDFWKRRKGDGEVQT